MTENTTSFLVERDPTFTRIAADKGIAFFLGRDIEFIFFVSTSKITRIATEGDAWQSIEAIGDAAEACRIRLSPGEAVTFSLDILGELISNGKVKMDALRAGLDRVLAKSPKTDQMHDDEVESDEENPETES